MWALSDWRAEVGNRRPAGVRAPRVFVQSPQSGPMPPGLPARQAACRCASASAGVEAIGGPHGTSSRTWPRNRAAAGSRLRGRTDAGIDRRVAGHHARAAYQGWIGRAVCSRVGGNPPAGGRYRVPPTRPWSGWPVPPAVTRGSSPAIREYTYAPLEEVLDQGADPMIVIDGVTDPRNLGAILRSAECAGVHAVVIAQGPHGANHARRSQGLRRCMGASDKVAQCGNVAQTLEAFKAGGLLDGGTGAGWRHPLSKSGLRPASWRSWSGPKIAECATW